MKAVIELYDVPKYQIGQEVTIYFRDTMQMRGICDEMRSKVVLCKDCKYGYILPDSAYIVCGRKFHDGQRHEANWFCADGERKE